MQYYFKNLLIIVISCSLLQACGGNNSSSKDNSPETQTETNNSQVDINSLLSDAKNGNAEAQYKLAVLYQKGEVAEQNNKEAAVWLKKAAEQGHPQAILAMGYNYLDGIGVEQNLEMAVDWFIRAADEGLEFSFMLKNENPSSSQGFDPYIPKKLGVIRDKFFASGFSGADTPEYMMEKSTQAKSIAGAGYKKNDEYMFLIESDKLMQKYLKFFILKL